MQREDEFIGLKREGSANCYGFLADAGKPLADLALAKELEHFVLDHAREQDAFVEANEILCRELIAFEFDRAFHFGFFTQSGKGNEVVIGGMLKAVGQGLCGWRLVFLEQLTNNMKPGQ